MKLRSILSALAVIASVVAAGSPTGAAPTAAAAPAAIPSATTSPTSAPKTPPTYWMAGTDGSVYALGAAPYYGSEAGTQLQKPVVGMAGDPASPGYWLVASDGGIFAFGNAKFYGSAGSLKLNKPIVGMAPTPDGAGYWMVASDGGIFTYGDANFYGSAGSLKLNKPIVGMASTPDGAGYWMVASDGGIFTYGDAKFYGSAGSLNLVKPIVGMASTPDGAGYWMVASDGGIFTYGDATFRGSESGQQTTAPITTMAVTHSVNPYNPGAVGYDISWPDCSTGNPPAPSGLAVVGVNDGLAFTHNPCLAAEAQWASTSGGGLTFYMNINSATPSTASEDATGPKGTCASNDTPCQDYNFGWNAAQDAFSYASSLGISSPMWWLDVEGPPGSSDPLWSPHPSDNAVILQAAIDALDSLGVQPGVYSTPYQWNLIAGSFAPDVPMWEAGASDLSTASTTEYCSTALKGFTAGPIWLVQYADNTWDHDYACP
ncbi:MAG TPA: hypothetical protein VFP54_11255 [Acidimicrobiales bacterium]|nr:hypothetical protein [Acidimicrobiales bacterium]